MKKLTLSIFLGLTLFSLVACKAKVEEQSTLAPPSQHHLQTASVGEQGGTTVTNPWGTKIILAGNAWASDQNTSPLTAIYPDGTILPLLKDDTEFGSPISPVLQATKLKSGNLYVLFSKSVVLKKETCQLIQITPVGLKKCIDSITYPARAIENHSMFLRTRQLAQKEQQRYNFVFEKSEGSILYMGKDTDETSGLLCIRAFGSAQVELFYPRPVTPDRTFQGLNQTIYSGFPSLTAMIDYTTVDRLYDVWPPQLDWFALDHDQIITTPIQNGELTDLQLRIGPLGKPITTDNYTKDLKIGLTPIERDIASKILPYGLQTEDSVFMVYQDTELNSVSAGFARVQPSFKATPLPKGERVLLMDYTPGSQIAYSTNSTEAAYYGEWEPKRGYDYRTYLLDPQSLEQREIESLKAHLILSLRFLDTKTLLVVAKLPNVNTFVMKRIDLKTMESKILDQGPHLEYVKLFAQ